MHEPTDDDFISCLSNYHKKDKSISVELSINDIEILIYALEKLMIYLDKNIKNPFPKIEFSKFPKIENLLKRLNLIIDQI